MARKASMGLDHISLMLSNIEEGMRFFHTILGFPVLTDLRKSDKEVVVVRAGRVHIELWQRDRCSPDNRKTTDKKPVYLNHLAFQVRGLDELMDEVRSAGYEVIEEIYVPTEGVREAMILGPDGLNVQFVEQNISKLLWRTVSGALRRDVTALNMEPDQDAETDKEAK